MTRRILLKIWALFYAFPKLVECPCCGWQGRSFLPLRERTNELCPVCQARARHRFLYLVLRRMLVQRTLPKNPKILHVAPELLSIRKLLKEIGRDGYLSIDITPGYAMKIMDITNLVGFERGYFDFIFISHVLEHVINQNKALREIKRVLRPKKGIAVICVPLDPALNKSYEFTEEQVADDKNHHRRTYGMDFSKQLRKAGFLVEIISALNFSKSQRQHFGLRVSWAAICRKP